MNRGPLLVVVSSHALLVGDLTIVIVGLPQIQADLGVSLDRLQWVVAAYALTMAAFTQPAGSLADRFGRRRVYAAGIAVFTIASLLAALSGSILALDAARVLQGVGAAMIMGNSLAMIADAYTGERRAMAIAVFGTVLQVAAVAAPLVGGLLVTFSWRWMFLVNVPVGAAAFVFALTRLPRDEPAAESGPVDWVGTVLLVLALGCVNLTLLRGSSQGWASPSTLLQAALGVALLVAFVLVERRVRHPVFDLDLFRIPSFAAISGLALLSRVITIGGTVYLVFHVQLAMGLSALQSGLVLVPVVATQTAFGLLAGRLQARISAGRLIGLGYAVKAVAAVLVAALVTPEANVAALLAALAVWGAGGGLAGAPTMSVAVGSVPPGRTGMASGATMSLLTIGAGIGAPVMGVLFGVRSGIDPAALDASGVEGLAPDAFRAAVAGGTASVMLVGAFFAAVCAAVAFLVIARATPVPQQPERAR